MHENLDMADLTLRRWVPWVLDVSPRPRGLALQVMTYFLAHSRSPADARSALDFAHAMQPRLIGRLREELDGLNLAQRKDCLDRGATLISRRVSRAVDVCRRVWAIPFVSLPFGWYYVDLPGRPLGIEELTELVDLLPHHARREYDGYVQRLIHVHDALEQARATAEGGRRVGGSAGRAARDRWGATPICYQFDARVAELEAKRAQLASILTEFARALQSEPPIEIPPPRR